MRNNCHWKLLISNWRFQAAHLIMKRLPIAVIIGTRPEAIKMAPVIRELSRSKILRPVTVSTSQHRHMVNQIFQSFGIRADHELRVMRPEQTLWQLSGRLASKLGQFLDE